MHRMRAGMMIAIALAGCDSLASNDYVGDPMITLRGTFATTANAPEDPVEGVALLWQDSATADGPGVATTAVPVAIQFPATFRVDVPTPPPSAARFGFADGDVELGEAYVYVVAEPAAAELQPLGSDREHVLVYASADVAAGTLAADYLGGPLSAGYHLRRFAAVDAPGTAQAALIAKCVAGGATSAACATRRAYQLGDSADDAPLRIVVTPP
jgi:hypothetical protein